MKKILALVLSLVMVLTAVSAMAAGSKTADDQQNAVVVAPAVVKNVVGNAAVEDTQTLKILDVNSDAVQAIIDLFAAANEAGDVLSVLPDDIRAQIPEGLTKINEIVTAQFDWNTDVTGSVTLKIGFKSEFEEGQNVAVLFGKLTGTDVAWTVAEGTTEKDGDVVKVKVTIPADLVKSLGNEPFILAVVSK